MRTIVTLDPDIAEKLRELTERRCEPLRVTANDVLRRGLAAREASARRSKFVVQPHRGGFRPAVDPARLDQLLDELEVEDFIGEASRDA
jgi:hypothetical protein